MTYHFKPSDTARVFFPRTGATVDARVAFTEEERIRGLHGCTGLAPNEGLLFLFPEQRDPIAMTMAKMLIPLDIIFIGSDLTVHHIAHRVRAGRQQPVLGPAVPLVLEVPFGFARRSRIVCGDRVAGFVEWKYDDQGGRVVSLEDLQKQIRKLSALRRLQDPPPSTEDEIRMFIDGLVRSTIA